MIILGITGSIATGKSTVAAWLNERSIPVFEADAVVHDLFLSDQQIIKKVGVLFPESLKDGKIDRNKLADIVFTKQEYLKKLETIVHPRVYQIQKNFLKSHQTMRTPFIVLEVPLLYEKGYDKICDYVIVMTCNPETQKYRTLLRPGMTEDRLKKIKSAQMPDKEKFNRADYVLNTEEPKGHVFQNLSLILKEIQAIPNLSFGE
ncbi:MAG: dephospho-CoA kinase [Alphaproteobacteria bacterium]|nr:dephospho-CoA kinase [Alphaproteobacteria bacterium]